jgi:DNA gyrase inhibitor GyrI
MALYAVLTLAGLTAAAFGGWWLLNRSIETPAYTVVSSAGGGADIEIRDYPAMVVAEVVRNGARWEAVNQGFRSLAAYIFAKNRAGDQIAMTAPVTQEPEKIAMTAPVTQESVAGGDGRWTIRFIMPAKYPLSALPAPGGDVTLTEIAPERRAAIRFSGVATDEVLKAREAELRQWIVAQGLEARGPATFAYYNDPFTPGFLRRNEVIISLAR